MISWRGTTGAGVCSERGGCRTPEDPNRPRIVMNPRDFANRIAEPASIDVSRIEQELTSYWKAAADQEGEKAVFKSCSCNLVVVVPDGRAAEDLPTVLARVAEWHPCRAIVAYGEPETEAPPDSGKSSMRAWIAAYCPTQQTDGPQICCEVVTLASRGEAFAQLPDTILSLLVPDLPIFLYWRSFSLEDLKLIERLRCFSHLVILDSHTTKRDPENRRHMQEFLASSSSRTMVRDLNWARLSAWRDLIAQFFNPPSLRPYLREISEVEIDRSIDYPGSLPTRTLLLTGWLATRLGWKRLSSRKHEDYWISSWEGPGGEILVRLAGRVKSPGESAGIASIKLRTRSGIVFSVDRKEGESCLTATAAGSGPHIVHSVLEEPEDEASLLIRELNFTGEDEGFPAAFAEANSLEQSFKDGS